MAPEILKEESYSYPVDWFAMGCSIYEMIAGRTPFKDFKEKVGKDEVKRRTLEDEVKFENASFTEEAKDICRLFLAKKTEDRLGSRYALLLRLEKSQINAANNTNAILHKMRLVLHFLQCIEFSLSLPGREVEVVEGNMKIRSVVAILQQPFPPQTTHRSSFLGVLWG